MAMEETYTLTCKFKDTENKTRTIEINNPTENLTNDKILDFMNHVIDSNVLVLNELDPNLKFASVAGAYLTTKTVEDITLIQWKKVTTNVVTFFQFKNSGVRGLIVLE